MQCTSTTNELQLGVESYIAEVYWSSGLALV